MLLGIAIILLVSVLSSKIMVKIGVPTLLVFILIGMFLGEDGFVGINFDNAKIANDLGFFALAIIIFYGGLSTNWQKAKKSLVPSGILASVGIVITTFIIALFVNLVFHLPLLEGLLLGAILSSTDPASVFSILTTHKLNLKSNMSYLLEMESGSNDWISFTLTMIFINLILGVSVNVPLVIFLEIFLGAICGLVIGKLSVYLINKIDLSNDGMYSVLLIGIALFSYAFTKQIHGNGFLSIYLTGIVIGNHRIVHRFSLIKYFDGLSWLLQIGLFLMLGLLVVPHELPNVVLDGFVIMVFLTLIARPIVVFICLIFSKYTIKEKLLISWGGFRGAASIVFAAAALTYPIESARWIFNIVFVVCILSVVIQGSLFIVIAKQLDVIEDDKLSLTKIYDESGKITAEMLEVVIPNNSKAVNKMIVDLDLPDDILIVMIKREGKVIIPRGNVKIMAHDSLLFAGDKAQLFSLGKQINSLTKNK
ncbi:MAG: potassium/proton antiporter [Bacilli bacterium]|jgi:cell volume regulation protein A|nr:potassium/proton antiporter [Bacilli bacterium]